VEPHRSFLCGIFRSAHARTFTKTSKSREYLGSLNVIFPRSAFPRPFHGRSKVFPQAKGLMSYQPKATPWVTEPTFFCRLKACVILKYGNTAIPHTTFTHNPAYETRFQRFLTSGVCKPKALPLGWYESGLWPVSLRLYKLCALMRTSNRGQPRIVSSFGDTTYCLKVVVRGVSCASAC
jgi:hypothetical protein